MELERTTYEHLKKYLIEHGYPKNSIASEFQISRNCRVDVAIIDKELNTPIQLFEIKSSNNPSHIKVGIEQLQRDLSFLEKKDIPCFLVFPKSSQPYFEIRRVDLSQTKTNETFMEEKNAKNPIILDYEAQRLSRRVRKSEKLTEQREKIIDWFRVVCWIMAFIILVIALLYQLGILVIDAYLLFLLSVIVALIVIPFVEKVKILGVEISRNRK